MPLRYSLLTSGLRILTSVSVLVLGCDVGDPDESTPVDVADAYSPDAVDELLPSPVSCIPSDDPSINGWAESVVDYEPGEGVDDEWTDTANATGPAEGTAADILCLGSDGAATLSFAAPIADGPGPDLAVFENSFSDVFLELAFVEVSTDNKKFARFDVVSLTPAPVPSFGTMDPTLVQGLAGTCARGLGTPFDLAALAGHPAVVGGDVSLDEIRFVRIVDVVGDGGSTDSLGNPIYDPYPTAGSAGFDLDAVAVLEH